MYSTTTLPLCLFMVFRRKPLPTSHQDCYSSIFLFWPLQQFNVLYWWLYFLHFVVQAFCNNLGTFKWFLSELIQFLCELSTVTFISCIDFHSHLFSYCTFLFVLVLFHFLGGDIFVLLFIFLPSIPSHPLLQSCLPGFSFLCVLKTGVNSLPTIFLNSMFSLKTCLCRFKTYLHSKDLAEISLMRRHRDSFSVAKFLKDL